MIEIKKTIESNVFIQCALCEKFKYKIFEIKRDGKILCMCQECLNDLSNFIIKMYKKQLKGACIRGIIIDEVEK